MSADGFIVDPEQPLRVYVTCYRCSRPIYPDDTPAYRHESCRTTPDGKLPVQIEFENYEAL